MNSKTYKSCSVPQCLNTTIKTPNKLFVYVSRNKKIRNIWLNLARRNPADIGENTSIYFCEDHFDLPNDMENYIRYHVMGSVSQIQMKRGCIPTKFECQSDSRKRTLEWQPKYVLNKQRKMIGEESLKDFEAKKSEILKDNLEVEEPSPGYSGTVMEEIYIKEENCGNEDNTFINENTDDVKEAIDIKKENISDSEEFDFVKVLIKEEDVSRDYEFDMKSEEIKIKIEEGQESEENLLQSNQEKGNVDVLLDHSYFTTTSTDSGSETTTSLDYETTELFKCDICSFQTNCLNSFIDHMPVHKNITKDEMFKCPICEYQTKYIFSLRRHVIVHKSANEVEIFKCDICPYQSRYKNYVTRHMIVHKNIDEVDVFKCHICKFQTKYKYVLTSHMIVHKNSEEVEMYKCEKCDFQTKHKRYIKVHVTSHNKIKDKMFKCQICEYKTMYKKNLETHIFSHEIGSWYFYTKNL